LKKLHLLTVLIITSTFLVFISWNNAKPKSHFLSNIEEIKTGKNTIENMQTAYKGEIIATAKYVAFVRKDEQEGFNSIAILQKAVSFAESTNGQNHHAVIANASVKGPIIKPEYQLKTLKENLLKDINGEAYEADKMNSAFLKTAEAASTQTTFLSLSYAMKTEVNHKAFFEHALAAINSNSLKSLPTTYFVYPFCFNIYSQEPIHCDFSLTQANKFSNN